MIQSQPTPYYEYNLALVRKCENSSKFPIFENKFLYRLFLRSENVSVEFKYPLFHWKHIWRNFHFSNIHVFQKEYLYKHLHNVLMVRKRLFELRLSDMVCVVCVGVRRVLFICFIFVGKAHQHFSGLGLVDIIAQYKPVNNIRFLFWILIFRTFPRATYAFSYYIHIYMQFGLLD